MGRSGKKSEPSKQNKDKPATPKKPPVDDDDYEDGDIATPKQDRYGTDDEPL